MAKPDERSCGLFIARCYPEGKTLFAGMLGRWLCEFELVRVMRFQLLSRVQNYRIDLVLMLAIDSEKLKSV